jgi:hypothetical protein
MSSPQISQIGAEWSAAKEAIGKCLRVDELCST